MLPGVNKIPDDLLFLRQFNWVSFKSLEDDFAFDDLEWGIIGVKPILSEKKDKSVQREVQALDLDFSEALGGGITLDMVAIPGDKFMMRSPEVEGENNEEPQHKVIVQPFFVVKYSIGLSTFLSFALYIFLLLFYKIFILYFLFYIL